MKSRQTTGGIDEDIHQRQTLQHNSRLLSDDTSVVEGDYVEAPSQAIGFFKAWTIPGVVGLSVCYFGLKFANYGLMLWLPTYVKDELNFSDVSELIITLPPIA